MAHRSSTASGTWAVSCGSIPCSKGCSELRICSNEPSGCQVRTGRVRVSSAMALPATMKSCIRTSPRSSFMGGFTGASAQMRRLSRVSGPALPSGMASTFTT